MKYTSIILLSVIWFKGFSQYDFLIDSLGVKSAEQSMLIKGDFLERKVRKGGNTAIFYQFSDHKLSISYYPKAKNKCGFFIIANQTFSLDSAYNWNLGCDLDYGSLNVYRLNIRDNRFLIITAISFGSGTSTRHVFCNVFDITGKKIKYYPLESIYGSGACFGDFDNDGQLDFVKMSNDSTDSENDKFFLRLYTLDSVSNRFLPRDRYILFARSYTSNSMHVDIIKKNW